MAEVFGQRYEVVERVGDGGMATVFRGQDRVLRRDVAIKVMHPHLQARADARARFSREAQAIARLKHANIVDVYDFSADGAEQSYLVTEFVHGGTLTQWGHAHGPLYPQSAALLGHAIAGALVHAHAAGIVHRDIKPDNLMVSKSGQLKLMDFGIATAMDMEQMTATGAMVGSPAHMAPEQIQGDALDHRCDIFAFGIVLYFLVTRRLPFQASNPHALFRLILEGNYEPASVHNPWVDSGFDELLAKCLAREPSARFDSAQLLQTALALYLRRFKMSDTGSLLPRLLQAPEQFQLELKPNLVRVLSDEGQRLADAGQLAQAIDAWNRALAFDPDAQAPHDGIARLQRAAQRRRLQRQLAAAAGVLVLLLGVVALWWRDPAPTPQSPQRIASATAAVDSAAMAAAPLAADLTLANASAGVAAAAVDTPDAVGGATPSLDTSSSSDGASVPPAASPALASPRLASLAAGSGALQRTPALRQVMRERARRTEEPPAATSKTETSLPVAGPGKPEPVKVKVQLGCVPPSGHLRFAGNEYDGGIAALELEPGEYAFQCTFEQTCPGCPPVQTRFRVRPEDKLRGKLILKGIQPR